MNERDRAWINAIRRYLGDGSEKTCVPYFLQPDGFVDTNKTLDSLMEMYGIQTK